MGREAKAKKRRANLAVVRGIRKRLLAFPELPCGGTIMTPDDLIALVESHTALLDEIDRAHIHVSEMVSKERQLEPRVRRALRGLKSWILSRHGEDLGVLGDFGWQVPGKPGPKKVAVKAASAEKARATRSARHTMGKRQKAKIKGSKG